LSLGRKLFLVVFLIFFSFKAGKSITYIEIDSPTQRLYRLAFFIHPKDKGPSERIERVLKRCLEISHLFELVDLPSNGSVTPQNIDYATLKRKEVELVLSVKVETSGKEVLLSSFLFDPLGESLIKAKTYRSSQEGVNLICYKLVDEILETLTGRSGIFCSRIAFIRQIHPYRELWMIYPEGSGEMPLLRQTLCMSPRFSPDGKKLLLTNFKRMNPDLYMLELETGKLNLVSSKPGPNSAPSWSPDGKKVVLSLRGTKGFLDLFLLDLNAGSLTALTETPYTETSPSFSPDGKRLVFVSDRTGNPQLYIMDLESRKSKPLTQFGSYNAEPSWSPQGDWIAFSGRWEGEFKIFIIRPDGSDLRLLTPYKGNHQNPSWAPNGRHLVFSSDMREPRSLYLTTIQKGGPWALTFPKEGDGQPYWSGILF